MYTELIKKMPKPTDYETDRFIKMFSTEHSWYKHLPITRSEVFIFYLDPNGGRTLQKIDKRGLDNPKQYFIFKENERKSTGWNYYTEEYTHVFIPGEEGIRDSRPYIGLNIVNDNGLLEPIPIEFIEKGKINLSRYIHPCFEKYFDYFDDEDPEISLSQKNWDMIKDLRFHLNNIIEYVYE